MWMCNGSREGSKLDDENEERGAKFLDTIYRGQLAPIVEKMGRHGDDISEHVALLLCVCPLTPYKCGSSAMSSTVSS